MTHSRPPMFEQFTHTSRRAMIFANSEAHRLRCGIIGDAEFLLGLIAQDSSAGLSLLRLLGTNIATLAAKLESIPRETATSLSPKLPQTKEVKLVLQGAIELAHARGSDRVGTLHITAAMLKRAELVSTQ